MIQLINSKIQVPVANFGGEIYRPALEYNISESIIDSCLHPFVSCGVFFSLSATRMYIFVCACIYASTLYNIHDNDPLLFCNLIYMVEGT